MLRIHALLGLVSQFVVGLVIIEKGLRKLHGFRWVTTHLVFCLLI